MITDYNSNPLKIFKNQVTYTARMGKNSYYETVTDENDRFCEDCKAKYAVKDQKYAPCQKCEVLPLG